MDELNMVFHYVTNWGFGTCSLVRYGGSTVLHYTTYSFYRVIVKLIALKLKQFLKLWYVR